MKQKKAFTLVELIIVIAIIAILAVSAFLVLTKWIGKSRDSRRKSDLGTIERALTINLSDYVGNPSGVLATDSLSGISILTGGGNTGVVTYQGEFDDNYSPNLINFDEMQQIPKDPSSTSSSTVSYIISVSANRKLFSLGATLEHNASDEIADMAYVRGNFKDSDSLSVYTGGSAIDNYSVTMADSLLVPGLYTGGAYTITTTSFSGDALTTAETVGDEDTSEVVYTVVPQ